MTIRSTEAESAKADTSFLQAAWLKFLIWLLHSGGSPRLRLDRIAAKQLKRAADKGSVLAARELGEALLLEGCNATDKRVGLAMVKQAAQAGDCAAQRYLGDAFSSGQANCEIDKNEAVHWFELAAEKGDVTAKSCAQRLRSEIQ